MIVFIDTEAAVVVVVVFLEESALSKLRRKRGLMCLKIVMMRMLMGNMKRPLSMATMNSCHVSLKEPVKFKNFFCVQTYIFSKKLKT